MSTNQNSTIPIFNGYHFFNDVIEQVVKKYDLKDHEEVYLRSTYFFVFFDLRKINDLLETNKVYFTYKSLKTMSYQCTKAFERDYFIKVSHAYVLSKFKKKLLMKKKQKDLTFELSNMMLDLSNTKDIDSQLRFDKRIYQWAHYTLKKFNAKIIPIEIYLVVICETYLVYYENQEIFKVQPDIINRRLVYQVLTQQLFTIGKKIQVNNGNISILSAPPMKDDFRFNMLVNCFDGSSSLELLTAYFGNKIWHKQIVGYDEEKKNQYFCFNEEPYMKVVNGIRDTSGFDYKNRENWGYINVFSSLIEGENTISLKITQSIYGE